MCKALSEQVPSHIFVIFSYCTFMKCVMAVTSKKARRERSRFTLQFEVSHKESQRLLYLGANCFFEGLFTGRKQHGMGTELVFTKRTQTSIYNSVTVGFARRNSIYGFFFSHLMSPLYTCSS